MTGSFADPGKMRSQIASTKAREQIDRDRAEAEEEAAAKKAEAEKDSENADPGETKTEEEETTFNTVWGMLTAKKLLDRYSGVRDMVRSKRYFLTGYATQTVDFGGQKFSFRTLKKSEQRLCVLLAEDAVINAITGIPGIVPDEFMRWQLLMMLKSVGGEEWDDLSIPSTSAAKRFKEESDKQIDKFCEDKSVLRRLEIIGEWSEQLYDKLVLHCQAINLAYSVAIEEDLKNP